MKITWLGQAGFMLEVENTTILIDPYLSDSVAAIEPMNKRRVEVDERFLDVRPDVIVLTHSHLDHTDPETLRHYLKEDSGICVLAPQNAWEKARLFKGNNNYVLFNRHTSVTVKNVRFTAVRAEHSDASAVGALIEAEGKRLYFTGDTLFNEDIFIDIPDKVDALFLPVNGVGNNMNMVDAKRFCERINPCFAIPMHCGLFDSIDLSSFDYSKKIVPEIYKEIAFGKEF